MKNSNNNRGNCIVTVLDANDLPPLNSNTSSNVITHDNTRNRRNFLQRFFLFRSRT